MAKKIKEIEKDIVTIGDEKKRKWFHAALIWTVVNYCLLLLAFLLSIAVVFIQVFLPTARLCQLVFSVATTVLTFSVFALNLRQQISGYRKAFYIVYCALIDYKENPNDENRHSIAEAIKKGEQIIGRTY